MSPGSGWRRSCRGWPAPPSSWFLGAALARWGGRGILNLTRRTTHIDPPLQPVLAALVRYAIFVMVFIAALSQIGVQTASRFASAVSPVPCARPR